MTDTRPDWHHLILADVEATYDEGQQNALTQAVMRVALQYYREGRLTPETELVLHEIRRGEFPIMQHDLEDAAK